jgi:GNAT superfamily N-acetyltransferase
LDCAETAWALDRFWVLPEKIGCGVGRAMMQHAMGLFLKSQADTLQVVSDPNAEGFYLKMGFEKVGVHPSTPEGRYIPILIFRKG